MFLDDRANWVDARGDTFSSIENLIGSDYADMLVGSNDANDIVGGMGADTIFALDGNDTITDFNAANGDENMDLSGLSTITDFAQLGTGGRRCGY